MAIRLVEEYPNRTGAPDAEYPHGIPRNRSAPGAVDGTPFEQAWFRDKEGFMQGLLETAGITPSGSPDTVTDSDYIDALVSVAHGVVEVDVGGSADTTLSIYPSRFAALKLTGGLAVDVDLIVPNTERLYWIIDETTGGFSVTVRTAAGTGVVVAEDFSVVRSDGTDVVYAQTNSGFGQNIAVFDTPGVTEWDVPAVLQAGLRKAKVTVIGGGAGGRARADDFYWGGGGAGGKSIGLLDLSGVASVDITVGSGGAGGEYEVESGTGNAGGSSSFGSYMSATGGETGGGQGSGGESGIGAGGDLNYGLGAGGSSAGDTGDEKKAGGTGGGPGGGSGSAASGSNIVAARNGTSPGAGGGGGGGTSTDPADGEKAGDGADGIVIVRW